MSAREDPIKKLLINIVVDVIICHWICLMVENEAGPDGFGYMVADKMTLFYAYYGLIDYNNPVWLQWVFDIQIEIFERFGIINNMLKMIKIVCQPGPMPGNNLLQPMGGG